LKLKRRKALFKGLAPLKLHVLIDLTVHFVSQFDQSLQNAGRSWVLNVKVRQQEAVLSVQLVPLLVELQDLLTIASGLPVLDCSNEMNVHVSLLCNGVSL